MTFTQERITNLLEFNSEGSDCQANAEQWEVHKLARIALASLEAEPVAWIVHARTGDQVTTDGAYVANAEGILGLHSTPLYTAPPAPECLTRPVHPRISSEELDDETLDELIDFRRSTFEYHSQQGNKVQTIIHGVTLTAMIELKERRAAMLQGADGKPELTVWYGAMPESNGKANWTAILHRKGEGRCMNGFTIDRSEYPGRVLYAADRVRYLIGEKSERPSILDYDADAHSGYMKTGNSPVIPDGYCIMPLKLTADNGAKGALCGEFHVQYRIVCQSCVGEGCEDCNHTGGWDAEIPVSWDTIKRIHESAVEACALPAAPQQEDK